MRELQHQSVGTVDDEGRVALTRFCRSVAVIADSPHLRSSTTDPCRESGGGLFGGSCLKGESDAGYRC